jgi:Right handed beta helix region
MKSHIFGFAVLAATAIVANTPVQAQSGSLTRSFVSSSGVDTNPCTITQPCASFAQAYTKVGANGIVAALDPGKYGPLNNITSGVTINGNGWAAITAPAGNNGITITAPGDKVTLIGLNIDGAGVGYNGILLTSAGSLTVSNCVLQNFFYTGSSIATGNGIYMVPSSGTLDFTITNTTAANNGFVGISYWPVGGTPTANGVIDHVVAVANGTGIFIESIADSGGDTNITVSNSIASDNSTTGIVVSGNASAPVKVSIDDVSVSGNSTNGIEADGQASVLLGRSVITANGTGVQNNTSGNTFYSYGNNQIGLNTTADGSSSLNKATYTLQ